MSHLAKLDAYFAQHRDTHLKELNDFLRIPSISSLSEHKQDMQVAASWLAAAMKRINLENISIDETKSNTEKVSIRICKIRHIRGIFSILYRYIISCNVF